MVLIFDMDQYIFSQFRHAFQSCKNKLPHLKKAWVTSNKMVHKNTVIWWPSFCVGIILFCCKYQAIRSSCLVILDAYPWSKTDHAIRKAIENIATKWYIFFCTILNEVTWSFGAMCCYGSEHAMWFSIQIWEDSDNQHKFKFCCLASNYPSISWPHRGCGWQQLPPTPQWGHGGDREASAKNRGQQW